MYWWKGTGEHGRIGNRCHGLVEGNRGAREEREQVERNRGTQEDRELVAWAGGREQRNMRG